MYKLTLGNTVIRQSDGACIPFVDGNSDYAEFKRWRDGWEETLLDGSTVIHAPNTPLPVDLPTLAQQQSTLLLQIDADADAIYGAVLGNRAEEYNQAYTDAQAYKAAGYSGVVPSSASSWATAKAQTATWAADDILATALAWKTAQAAIRANRLARKEAARNATTAAALANVQAQWAGFLAVIKPQLGL